jgi:hypothetical protein
VKRAWLLALFIATGCTVHQPLIAVKDKQFTHNFVPWGFNYDRDYKLRLLEEYWADEWATVDQDFGEMKAMGANVIRVHLQFQAFMDAPDQPNEANLARLKHLLKLAEQLDLRLDITGLASYRKSKVPPWYDTPDEAERWRMQANFWSAIADASKHSPAVLCYDLINEPVVPGKKTDNWLVPHELAGFSYVQHLSLDPTGRDRMQIARDWTRQMIAAIRKHDRRHMITIGLMPWSTDLAEALSPQLDYVSVHVYPASGKIDDALTTIKRFDFGKPLLVEETFPLAASRDDFADFLRRARPTAAGVIGFYWGKPPAELKGSTDVTDQALLTSLELFQQLHPSRSRPTVSTR